MPLSRALAVAVVASLLAAGCSGASQRDRARSELTAATPQAVASQAFCDAFRRQVDAEWFDLLAGAEPGPGDMARGLEAYTAHVERVRGAAPPEVAADLATVVEYLNAVADLLESHDYDLGRLHADASAADLEALGSADAAAALASVRAYRDEHCRPRPR